MKKRGGGREGECEIYELTTSIDRVKKITVSENIYLFIYLLFYNYEKNAYID